MPVALKLSKEFYEKVGEQVANELVDAFNQVDSTYRSDLKEMNEANFARFDAKVEARFAQQDARIDSRFAQQDARIDAKFAQFEARIERMFTERFAEMYRFMLLGWATVLAAMVAGVFALKN